jgi:biotin-dependent carboxylase-like uncharacterized protein
VSVTPANRSAIVVLRGGTLCSVQDLGRHGLRHLGISQCGAMDPLALQQANLLLGNAPGAAGLELSLGPVQLRFTQDCRAALTGVDFGARLQTPDGRDHAVLSGHALQIPAGAVLSLARPAIAGARAYLAVAGGIDVAPVLGSRSTDLKAGFGGHAGRALQPGDTLPVGRAVSVGVPSHRGVRSLAPTHVLRALPGPDYDRFTHAAHSGFWLQPWRISAQSNRMGLRLNGTPLMQHSPASLLSAGVLPGDVQVPADGLPIVLGVDCQTTGGYPRIASVIQADLWQLAQLSPLTSVYFQPVTHEVAGDAMQRLADYLERLAERLTKEAIALRDASSWHPALSPGPARN